MPSLLIAIIILVRSKCRVFLLSNSGNYLLPPANAVCVAVEGAERGFKDISFGFWGKDESRILQHLFLFVTNLTQQPATCYQISVKTQLDSYSLFM